MLAQALSSLPNVKHIDVEPVSYNDIPDRYNESNPTGKGSTTALMNATVAAVAASNTRLYRLTMPTSRSELGCHQGCYCSTFSLPRPVLPIFDELQELRLIVEEASTFDTDFLRHLPSLKHLDLIIDSADYTAPVPVSLTVISVFLPSYESATYFAPRRCQHGDSN